MKTYTTTPLLNSPQTLSVSSERESFEHYSSVEFAAQCPQRVRSLCQTISNIEERKLKERQSERLIRIKGPAIESIDVIIAK